MPVRQASIDEAEAVNRIYYRILNHDEPKVVTMQWFDEYDYDQKRFLTDEQFPTEEAAQAWIDARRTEQLAAIGSLFLSLLKR